MTKKPEKTLELRIDIDAPLEAAWKAITEGPGLANWFAPLSEVSAPGVGATVKNGWSEEMMMTSTVDAWEPLKHVRWFDDSGWMGPGTALAMDFYLSTENGKTRVRLVQSAFGASEGWDDLFAGTEVGWTYFLYNLRIYLEKHLGRVRRLINERLEAPMGRAAFWRHLLGATGGLVVGATAAVKTGDWVELRLSDPATVRAVVEVIVEGHAIGLRIGELTDALLFIELEGNGDKFHVGYWLSVYDEVQARRLDSPARRAFKRIHETLPKGEAARVD
jgi:uncharacterized protein YndB with AHSA1/START domain